MRYVLLSLLLLFLVGCTEPVIDTSSDAAMKNSIAKVEESLPDDKKAEFKEAIKYMLFSQLDMKSIFANAFSGIQVDKDKLQADMKKAVDGKTGLQVIEEARKLRDQREAKKREKEIVELEELEQKYENAQIQKEKMKDLKVLTTSYSVKKYQYTSRKSAEMLVNVKNDTGHAISAVYFNGKLVSSGRSVPWEEGVLYDYIKGGIEPSETVELSLYPKNGIYGWTSDDIPDDVTLVVEVSKLFGADKKELYKSDFSTRDQRRLDELREKFDDD